MVVDPSAFFPELTTVERMRTAGRLDGLAWDRLVDVWGVGDAAKKLESVCDGDRYGNQKVCAIPMSRMANDRLLVGHFNPINRHTYTYTEVNETSSSSSYITHLQGQLSQSRLSIFQSANGWANRDEPKSPLFQWIAAISLRKNLLFTAE